MPLPGPEQVIMLSKLFWPEFIEHRDCILRGDAFSQEHFDGFMTATKHDKRSVEHVVNHLHGSSPRSPVKTRRPDAVVLGLEGPIAEEA